MPDAIGDDGPTKWWLGGRNGATAIGQSPTPPPASSSPSSAASSLRHSDLFLHHWNELKDILKDRRTIEIDGKNLSLAHVVAVSRYSADVAISHASRLQVQANRENVEHSIARGQIIYGVNTGFGGSADTRTRQTEQLQRVLIRELHYGILADDDGEDAYVSSSEEAERVHVFDVHHAGEQAPSHLPRSWARASILIRMNSLSKGHSSIRPVILDRMTDLLRHDIIPMIPMRGSISASGDLSPLSYIGGALQGKPTIRILGQEKRSAFTALAEAGIEPLTLQSKEGLAIVNGTAVSAGSASLALHDAHGLLVLSQILTAMSVEAFEGTDESFDPFFSECRPHIGQMDSAACILAFLESSHFTRLNDGTGSALRQDRYSIRTVPQWLGPTLEDFCQAHEQLSTEINSTTDNPIINTEGHFLHGGNFQANSVTNAMEKVRQGIQSIGRMLFSQCTELINPATNRGLPPNLVIEDPNSSFIFKGTDIHIAALQSELGLLSAPCNHVMTAEMGNQSLNSLALISTRYTHTAIDVLSQMAAIHLLALCQALDIRALYAGYLSALQPEFENIIRKEWIQKGGEESMIPAVWTAFRDQLGQTVSMNADARFETIGQRLRSIFIDSAGQQAVNDPLYAIQAVTKALAESAEACWQTTRSAYIAQGSAAVYLGLASQRLYNFVRDDLGIPLLCTKELETPSAQAASTKVGNAVAPTVGTYNSRLYKAVRDGSLFNVVVAVLKDVKNIDKNGD